MEMNNLEAIKRSANEVSETMDAENVMRLKRVGNDGAVIVINGLEAFAKLISENLVDSDVNEISIFLDEFVETILQHFGDIDAKGAIERGLSAVKLVQEEMEKEP